jgi:hypothetical protein
MDGNGSSNVSCMEGRLSGWKVRRDVVMRDISQQGGHDEREREAVEGVDDRRKVDCSDECIEVGSERAERAVLVCRGMPIRRLRDYVQESGRVGRDGCQSEVMVVCRKISVRSETEVKDEKGQSWEEVVKE